MLMMKISLVIFLSMLAGSSLICRSLGEQQGIGYNSLQAHGSVQQQQHSYGSDVPGFNGKRKLEEDAASPSPLQAPVGSKTKHYAEFIAGGLVGAFFLVSAAVLVVYVCTTRKFIEQRRQASLVARGRSIEDQFVISVTPTDSSPDASVYFPPEREAVISGKESFDSSLYIPSEWGLYPLSGRGSQVESVSQEWALYPQSTRGSSARIEE